MTDPTLTRKQRRTDIFFPKAKLITNHFTKIAQSNLNVKKEFQFKKYKQSSIFWVDIPIIDKKIPPLVRTIVRDLADIYALDFYVRLETHNGQKDWMNILPNSEDKHQEVKFIGLLSIGFSKRTIDSEKKTKKTNYWYNTATNKIKACE